MAIKPNIKIENPKEEVKQDIVTPEVITMTPEMLEQFAAKIKAEAKAEIKAEIQSNIAMATEDKIEASTEKRFIQEEKSLKQILKEGEQVTVTIPVDPLNPNEPAVVGINGVFYSIPTGQEVEIPKPVYDIWKDSYSKTIAAMKQIKVEEVKEVEIAD